MSMRRDVKRANAALLAVNVTELAVTRVWRDSEQITLWLSATHRADKKTVDQQADRLVGTVFGYNKVWDVRREGHGFVVTGGMVDKAELSQQIAAERAARTLIGQPPLAHRIARVDVDGELSENGLADWHLLPEQLERRAPQLMETAAAVEFWAHAGLGKQEQTPEGIVMHSPTLLAVKRERDGISIAVQMLAGQGLPQWQKQLSQLRSLLHAPAMTVEQIKPDIVALSWHDVAPQFPLAVATPLRAVVDSMAAVLAHYPSWTVPLGVDPYGTVAGWTPRIQPHMLLVASTGGGKSVLVRGIVSDAVLAGASVWLGDGKGSDYSALRTVHGVQMVASTDHDIVIMVAALRQEMQRRVAVAEREKALGDTDPYSRFSPIVVILDEFATVAARLQEHDKKGVASFQSDIAEILRVGREPRVHMVLSTQELRADTIPGSWQENLKTLVALGQPSEQTLRFGFPEAVREAAAEAGGMIPQSAKGRAMVVDPDTREVRLVQTYWQYSPGSMSLDSAPTPDVRTAWTATADALTALPQLHPRMAVDFTSPDYRAQSIAALRDMSVVPLDSRSGPRADRTHLDPASPAYTGRVQVSDSGGLGWADDPEPVPAVQPMSKPAPPPPTSPPPAARPAAPTSLSDIFE
ncbi:type IV secretory system conjugative DNA transfer family protein [Tsukamurella pseudospumae]|uniref:FtsK domain-containing protein n=1 Tax=Tsukamurella pseudospumae TaxID=239498 RepID=A0A138AU17_9ACTN|nr:hypothetical protein [Tsukamurella pseudospumae]KXP13922.1 hypothetical protein AXK60_22730 [Tsukamurella pseudospumae]